VKTDILTNPGFEIYRSKGMYFFVNNKFQKEDSNINNGNVYTKAYLDRIEFPDKSGDEDVYITYGHSATIYVSELKHSMIYRWGMGTLHISGMGIQLNEVILAKADEMLDKTKGTIQLSPHFNEEYYEQL
jgi:hypothetical protein